MPTNRGRRVAIVGVGYSPSSRRSGRTLEWHTLMGCRAALEDAGLKPQDVDGVAVWGSPVQMVSATRTGSMLGAPELHFTLSTTEGPTFMGAAIAAMGAVASGTAEVCLAINTMLVEGGSYTKHAPKQTYAGDAQFTYPFGAIGGPHWISQYMSRHKALYGTTEEHFGHQAIAQREFAALNEKAFFRKPLTMDEYLSSRYICKPCRLLDCDYPIDGSGVVVFSTVERARSLKQKPVFVDTWSSGVARPADTYLMEDMEHSGPWAAGTALWRQTDLRPKDIHVASLYDGFTFGVLQWLEALRFCGEGESGPFVAEGNTRPGGRLPVNCDGGAINAGRTHGANHVIEVALQLRGQTGARQRPNARIGLAANSQGPSGGCMIMTTE